MSEQRGPGDPGDRGHGRTLVTGASGMLGRAWCELLTARGVAFDAATRQELDLTDAASIEAGVRPEHATIINCAAWTDVDGAEAEADEARATEVNGRGVERLLRRAEEVGARVVHYSTDYVFDGAARAPYGTDHPPAPINAYGRSKRVGEAAMHAAARAAAARGAAPAHLLIRTSWLYAPWGRSFVCTIAGLAREREELRVVADQRGRPTSAEHLAATSLALLERGASGTYHVTDGGQCTWFELAEVVAAEVAPRCRVVACTTADMPRPARRPAWSVLDLTRTEALLGPMPPWQSNVRGVVARLPTQ